MRKVKARLQGMTGSDRFTLQCHDRSSSAFLFEIDFTKEQLASVLMAQGIEAEIEFASDQDVSRIGKEIQNKVEIVACRWDASIEEKRAAIAPLEVDGWMGHAKDIGNHHNSRGRTTSDGTTRWAVSFYRYVDPS